jgi:hypothetical protein
MIKGAKLPERSVMICLDQGLTAEMEILERKLADVQKDPSAGSLAGDPAKVVAREIEALRATMLEHSAEFRFRALPRMKFSAMVAAHAPRDIPGDQALGVNEETMFVDLIRACTVSPELDDEDWTRLLGEDGVLSSAQFDLLANTAWMVNRRDVDVPFSRNALRTLQISEDA